MTEATIDLGDLEPVVHYRLGTWTVDVLLADPQKGREGLGPALRSSYELYGNPSIGKSTIAEFCACKIRPTGFIYHADLEGTLDERYLRSVIKQTGFHGTYKVIDAGKPDEKDKTKKVPRSHEEMTKEAVSHLSEAATNAVIIDSLGAFTPLAQMDGDLDEAYWGMRAKRLAVMSRQAASWLRNSGDSPSALFMVNHIHDEMGGQGHYTPGGTTKEFLASYRLLLYKDKGWDDGFFAVGMKAEKLKYGGVKKDARGFLFMVPGFGVSPQMTAVYDCIKLGIAEAKTHVRLEVDGKSKSFGFLSKLVESATKPDVDHERFMPFFEKLEGYYEVVLGPTLKSE
jgi:RecA/RadA recombinase